MRLCATTPPAPLSRHSKRKRRRKQQHHYAVERSWRSYSQRRDTHHLWTYSPLPAYRGILAKQRQYGQGLHRMLRPARGAGFSGSSSHPAIVSKRIQPLESQWPAHVCPFPCCETLTGAPTFTFPAACFNRSGGLDWYSVLGTSSRHSYDSLETPSHLGGLLLPVDGNRTRVDLPGQRDVSSWLISGIS